MEKIQSERLELSLMDAGDVDLLYQIDQDKEVMRYINGGKKTSREDVLKVFIPRMESYRNTVQGWGLWKVKLKKSGDYIGWVLVRPMNFFSDFPELDNIELGWRFMRKSWGKGYATEAAICIKQWLSANAEIKRLTAVAIEENDASIKVMKKLGMSYLKTDMHKDPLGDTELVYYQLELN